MKGDITLDIKELQSNDFSDLEPYVGMPIEWLQVESLNDENPETESLNDVKSHVDAGTCDEVDTCPLAMAYVPWQTWRQIYDPQVALSRGTIFQELDLPFLGGGTR